MPQITPRFRPLEGGWTDPKDPATASAQFRVDERSLWIDLSTEVRHLQDRGHPDEVIVQLDVPERDIRVDGTGLKAGADVGYHGVVVSFESRHGPLRYPADHFRSWGQRQPWRANIRAVTLTLAALRAIDRYGVASGGQQYTGWKQLGSGTGHVSAPGAMSIVEAMAIIEHHWSDGGLAYRFDPRVERLTKDQVRRAYRAASLATHPDTGGSVESFAAVQAANAVLMRNAR